MESQIKFVEGVPRTAQPFYSLTFKTVQDAEAAIVPTTNYYALAMTHFNPAAVTGSQHWFNLMYKRAEERECCIVYGDELSLNIDKDDDEGSGEKRLSAELLVQMIKYIAIQTSLICPIGDSDKEEEVAEEGNLLEKVMEVVDIMGEVNRDDYRDEKAPGARHGPVTTALTALMRVRKGSQRANTNSVDERRERHNEYIGSMMSLPAVHTILKKELEELKVASPELLSVLNSICTLPAPYREVLVKLLGLYGLAGLDGGPTYVSKDGYLTVEQGDKDVYAFKLNNVTDDDLPPQKFKHMIRQPPGVNNAVKHASIASDEADYPIAVNYPDPNGLLNDLICMRNGNVVTASKSNIFYNVTAQQEAFNNIYHDATTIYKDQVPQEDLDTIMDKNIFVNMNVTPDAVFSRYTVVPVMDKEFSNTANHNYAGYKFHSQRYDKVTIDPGAGKEIHSACTSVPPQAIGGDRASTFLAICATGQGKEMIDAVAGALSDGKYKKADATAYENYTDFYQAAIFGKTLSKSQEDTRSDFAVSPEKVVEFWDKTLFKSLLKVFSSHLGFLGVIGLEASICGIPALTGLISLKEMGAFLKPEKITAIACHELVSKLGGKITATDGFAGQSIVGGLFRPINPKYYKTEGMIHVNLDNKEIKDANHEGIIPHKRYFRGKQYEHYSGITVLIDLTVPGMLYCPQNAQKAADTTSVFKGQKVLVDDKFTEMLYTPKQLAAYKFFMVYMPITVFTTASLRKQMEELEVTHHFSFSPGPVLCLMGTFVIGWRKDVVPDSPIRTLTANKLKNTMVAHVVAKSYLLMDHFSAIPPKPKLIYNDLIGYPKALKLTHIMMRRDVGDAVAIREYAKRTRENGANSADFTPEFYYKGAIYQPDGKNVLDEGQSKWRGDF